MYQWSQTSSARSERLDGGSGIGAAIDSSGSTNTKGNWIELIAATSFAYEYLVMHCTDTPSNAGTFTWDLGIGAAGSEFVIAQDLRAESLTTIAEQYDYYGLPLHIPAGVRVAARSSCGSAAPQNFRLAINGFSNGLRGRPGFSRCVTLTTAASSKGLVVDPGAVANTFTRTQITAATPFDIEALLLFIGGNREAARIGNNSWLIDIEMGASGQEITIIKGFQSGFSATSDTPCSHVTPIFPCFVPAGTRMSVNASCSSTTTGDRTFDLTVIGFSP